jgi:hypothetical protein
MTFSYNTEGIMTTVNHTTHTELALKKSTAGIQGLDKVTLDGLPLECTVLVYVTAKHRKTLLTMQFQHSKSDINLRKRIVP